MKNLPKERLIEIINDLIYELNNFADRNETISICLECGVPKKVIEKILDVTIM